MGGALDRAVGDLLVEAMSPLALEVALSVQEELQARADEADRLRHQQVERARYEAELAQRRYLRVDPDNRLVASSLEAEWDAKLRALAAAQDDYERQRAEQTVLDTPSARKSLHLLLISPACGLTPPPRHASAKPWPGSIEDVTLLKGDEVVAHVRFRGGAAHTITLPRPKRRFRTLSPAFFLHLLGGRVAGEKQEASKSLAVAEQADDCRGEEPLVLRSEIADAGLD